MRTPLFYPDAITLQPGCTAAEVLTRIDTDTPAASVKDSYADLDLSDHGFAVLFDAQWVAFDDSAPSAPTGERWQTVDDAAWLQRWATAWDAEHSELFPSSLLDDDSTTVIAGLGADDAIVAGAVLTRAAGVVGVSNVFGPDGGGSPWTGVLATAERLFPATTVVGYESGDELDAAIRHDARPVGPLRVWMVSG